MTHPAPVARLGTESDDFLFASVGTGRNGMSLTVVSALARLDLDPWWEAANFAGMPTEAATQRLASMIAAIPDEPSASRDAGPIAARLLALLPRGARAGVTPRVSLDGIGAPANSWIMKYVILVVAVMAIQSLLTILQPPAPVDNGQDSTTSIVAAQKPSPAIGQ
jgi:hypothetical protein